MLFFEISCYAFDFLMNISFTDFLVRMYIIIKKKIDSVIVPKSKKSISDPPVITPTIIGCKIKRRIIKIIEFLAHIFFFSF